MDWFTGLVLFFLIWWTALFMVLPWGLKRTEDGKPESPRLKSKILITTLLSVLIWGIVYGLIRADVIDFRQQAREMAESDRPL